MSITKRPKGDPEFELLLVAARTSLDDKARDRLHALLKLDLEWGHLLYLSRFHRVTELLYQTLRAEAPAIVRGEVENYLRSTAHRTAAYNMVLVAELGRVQARLASEDIPMIAFKGPLLAQDAYGNMGLRGSVDLDVLVRSEDFPRLQRVLAAAGYELAGRVKEMRRMRRKAYLGLSRQLSFVNRQRMTGLDVHTGVLPPGYRYEADFDNLLDRSRRLPIGGARITTFAPEDMVHLLCYHGVKNRWDQLKYVCDVAEFVGAHGDLDWDEVIRRARSTHGERVLYHGLDIAHLLLNAELPPQISHRISSAGYTDLLADVALTNLLHSHDQLLGRKERLKFHLLTQDDFVNRARYSLYSMARHLGGVIDI